MSGLYTRWTEGRPDVAKYAYVVRSKTDVRTGPGPDAEPTGRVLEADQRIEVSERRTLEDAQTFLKLADAASASNQAGGDVTESNYVAMRGAVKRELGDRFRPEFLNR